MKMLLVILIVALVLVGLTASVLPSLASQNPSHSPATPVDYTHSTSAPGMVPQVVECDCAPGGC
jgi:hypothetical protein